MLNASWYLLSVIASNCLLTIAERMMPAVCCILLLFCVSWCWMLVDIGCLLVCYCQLISDDYCWQNDAYVCCLQHTTVFLYVTWFRMLADMCCLLWPPALCWRLLTEWCLPGSTALLHTTARLYYILLLPADCCWRDWSLLGHVFFLSFTGFTWSYL